MTAMHRTLIIARKPVTQTHPKHRWHWAYIRRARSDRVTLPRPRSSCRGIVSPPPSYGRYASTESSSIPIAAVRGSRESSSCGGHRQRTTAWLRHSTASLRQPVTSARPRRVLFTAPLNNRPSFVWFDLIDNLILLAKYFIRKCIYFKSPPF